MAKSGQDLGGSLKAQIEPRDGGTWIALSGPITELADLTPLTRQRGPLRMDLAGVDRINSVGVRNWIQFVTKAETMGLSVAFERVSPALVLQMSMITNFMGTHPQIRSLLAPYLCTSCQNEHLQAIEVTPGVPVAVPGRLPCPKCGQPMQLDELEAMYGTLFARA